MSGDLAMPVLLIVLAIANLACVIWNAHHANAARAERRQMLADSDSMPVPHVTCPSCGTSIRARMTDKGTT